MKKERIDKIVEIAKRAEKMSSSNVDRITLIMDLEHADKEFNLRLDEFLEADNFNFAHDIIGIQRSINRQTREFEGFFLPRYAGY